MIHVHAFKNKKKEGRKGRPQVGGLWKVLIFGGLWKKKEKHIFTSCHFAPQQILFKPFFSIDLNVLFYHGSRPLLYTFPSFSLTYKL
jgi:hypothetical protein